MTDGSRKPGNPRAASSQLPPLYPIIDIDLCGLRGVEPAALAAACVAGGARVLQVRQKGTDRGSGTLLTVVRETIRIARPAGASVIVNDRADIAVMAGADGVHVGQQDLPLEDVRSIAGPHVIVGLSTHTTGQVDEAARIADYVAVGPVFTTATKDTGYEARGLELVRYAVATGKPVVAIGGINLDNARQVIDAGAASVAVISDLLRTGDPETRVRDYLRAIA